MAYPITQQFIPGLPQKPYRNGVGAYEGVVAHSTATPEATGTAERNFEAAHWQDAFVHFFVDDTTILQVADTKYLSYNAGPVANPRFVGVELCEFSDATKFSESYKRYVWLLAKILFDRKLGVHEKQTFWTHADVANTLGGTTHQDPIDYLKGHGVTVAQLVADVTEQYNLMANPPAPVIKHEAVAPPVRTGNIKVLVTQLNVRTGPGTNYPIVPSSTPLKIGTFKFYAVENGWYNLGGNQWVYGNGGKYVKEV